MEVSSQIQVIWNTIWKVDHIGYSHQHYLFLIKTHKSFILLSQRMSNRPREIQLEERLLKDNRTGNNNGQSKSFGPKWLALLFDNDNRRDNVSNKMLEGIGGYEGLLSRLKTNRQKGITADSQDKQERIQKYGKNDPVVKPPKTLWDMILENFEDPMLKILCVAAAVSLILGVATHGIAEGWIEGFSILLAVIIITVVASGNNYMKEKQFRKLNQVASRKNINVIRNGKTQNMSVYELLVGDLVYIETGQILSVDGIVTEANRLSIDESAMTGQTHTIKKQLFEPNKNNNCFLVSGTKVVQGTGKMIVLTVGLNTVENGLKQKLQQDDDETPLEEKLEVLADQIGKMGMWAAGLTLIALVFHLLVDSFKGHHPIFSLQFLNKLVDYVIISVSLIVMAVPEGLPLAVTISLAYSVGKMKDQNNLVRFLAACETMGGANNICSDKTGTLTKNQMTVTNLWTLQQNITSFDAKDKSLPQSIKELMSYGISLNSDAHPIKKESKFQQIGNKTECALLQMIYRWGYHFDEIREQVKPINVAPFSSDRKRMSVVYYLDQKKRFYIFSKGAPEILLEGCKYYVNKAGNITQIDTDFKNECKRVISQFSSQSLRTLLMCYREVTEEESRTDHPEKLEESLIVLGLAGIKDPLKEAVPEAVLNCKRAGITVRMVTGDNTETATAIAKDANIIPNDFVRPTIEGVKGYYVVMEGKEFRTLVGGIVQKQIDKDDPEYKQDEDQEGGKKKGEQPKTKDVVRNIEKFREITNELRVLARSSPDDKYLLATGLKQLENVVAMTGDGTNDAPALKKADIGFAMGIAGTEVAKEAAGIILLDDNFSSIITAVKYGRNIFDCIRKFLQFQLTVNVVAICMAFMGAAILKKSPLTPVQMLWVNLIMDTLAALALATEPPNDDLLKRMPYSRKQHIITAQMWRGIVFNGIYQVVILTIILFKGDQIFGVKHFADNEFEVWTQEDGEHLSIFFDIFVFLQIFNFLNARKLKKDELNVFANFFDNYLFIIIVIGIFVSQLFIVTYGGKTFELVPLSFSTHIDCILIGATGVVWNALIKVFIPESFMNTFELLREDKQEQIINVDSIFERWEKQPATERRKSKMRRSSRRHQH